MKDNIKPLYDEFEWCCKQWSFVLRELRDTNKHIADVLSLVSIKTFDREKNYILLAYNPKYKQRIKLFDNNPIIIESIQKYFGKVTIEFKENHSIVDPQDIKETLCQQKITGL